MTTKQLVFVDVTNHADLGTELRPTSVQGTFERFHAEGIQMETDGCVRVDTSGEGQMVLDVYGHVLADKVRARSDARLKRDIRSIQNGLDTVKQLSGKLYKMENAQHDSYGLIAQDVETVLPNVVYTENDQKKSVAYLELIPFIIEAIKELDTKVSTLLA